MGCHAYKEHRLDHGSRVKTKVLKIMLGARSKLMKERERESEDDLSIIQFQLYC